MKKLTLLILLGWATTSIFAQTNSRPGADPETRTNLDYIDPTIGNIGQLLEPTRPLTHLPNQVIRFTPQRKDYLDQQITSFPLTIVSHRLGQVFSVKPSINPLKNENWRTPMRYDRDLEVNRPWYYSTYLIDDDITVEFAPGKKAGFLHFSFPEAESKAILFDVYNNGKSAYDFVGDNIITGIETYHNDIPVYMYGKFSVAGKTQIDGKRASIVFPGSTKQVDFRYAISFISAEQAKKNFTDEVSNISFAQLSSAGKKNWETVMSQIQVEGGTEAQKRSFYTALYRCYERMVDITEDGQYYSGYNKKIVRDSRPFYVDDWSWDTYLAHHPLRTILNPAQQEDMLQSYVRMYEQSGWLPTFPVLFGDHACMNGFHSSIVFLDSYRKGLRHFDFEKAYEGMKKNAISATMIPWRNGEKTSLDDYYLANGYFPGLAPGEKEPVPTVDKFEKRQAVAVTLGHSYDDWAVGQLAKDLDKNDDFAAFNKRSKNFRALWDSSMKLFMPRDDKGRWIKIDPKFDGGPGGRDYYDENNGWTYQWAVQHDVQGLISLMGDKKTFENRLDQHFSEGLGRSKHDFWKTFPDATGLVGQFSMGNEPSFHIPYLYNYTDAPWKTQQRIRNLLHVWFKDNEFGIPGDEDGGGMSAFVVFSSMGFYPITPGLPVYTIGSPVFSSVTINLTNGKKFSLTARGASVVNKYIQSAKMNGKVLNTPWFSHELLMAGGHLELQMGPRPNKNWGITDSKNQHIITH
ncbi:GH92 family glycosyl hydrolase [Flavitalea sp.]|nr:GH92 family glycosyl hydrolase [Flavitalea sp.]